eukprot:7391578-Prymnesium_polylepis.1
MLTQCRSRSQAMTLPDLDRVHAVLKSAGELQTAFQAKAGWVKFRALIGEVQPGFVVAHHSSTCSSRVIDNLCSYCNVPCLTPIADYYGHVTVKDWSEPTKTFDIPFATAGGTCLFGGTTPNGMNIKSASEIRTESAALNMMPFKTVIKIGWNATRGEVSYLLMHARQIDTEGATYSSSPSLASYLGIADLL